MKTITIEAPTDDLRSSALTIREQARACVVNSQETLDSANDLLGVVKDAKKRVQDRLGPIIENAYSAHKGLTTLRAELLAPLDECERTVKVAVGSYLSEQKRIAESAQRERERVAREQEEAARLERAAQLEAQGRAAEAEAVIDAPIEIEVAPAAAEVPKSKGISTREKWSCRVDALLALVRYVAEHPEYINLLTPNQSALNDMARAQKAALSLPGCTAVRETEVSVRR